MLPKSSTIIGARGSSLAEVGIHFWILSGSRHAPANASMVLSSQQWHSSATFWPSSSTIRVWSLSMSFAFMLMLSITTRLPKKEAVSHVMVTKFRMIGILVMLLSNFLELPTCF
jgi:hypothetical protein